MFEGNAAYEGRIIKGIAGFYYIYVEGHGLVECRAKGVFRKDGIKPLVGDKVSLTITDAAKAQGIIHEIKNRASSLIRPEVANVDQVLLLFAYHAPRPNLDLLDKFLISMEMQEIPVVLCFNKMDLATEEERAEMMDIYADCGCELLELSASSGAGVERLRELLEGKTTALAGPSGVGKSTLTNALCPKAGMETGEISRKLERGKHTTRHSELLHLGNGTYLMDTPGFSALMLDALSYEELGDYYREFDPYVGECHYQPCSHVHEPECRVRRAVEENKIHPKRYESYRKLYEELKNRKKY